jgi:hypothetical protein
MTCRPNIRSYHSSHFVSCLFPLMSELCRNLTGWIFIQLPPSTLDGIKRKLRKCAGCKCPFDNMHPAIHQCVLKKYGPLLRFIQRFETRFGVEILKPSKLQQPPKTPAIPLIWSERFIRLEERLVCITH